MSLSVSLNEKIARSLIEAYVRSRLSELKSDPQRAARNLVDMARSISTGRFQKQFFELAQNMLQNEDSGYYSLIQDIAAHVDPERLITFGINLGYNSLTLGARTIRAVEAERHFNVPWAISLTAGEDDPEAVRALMKQGKELGVYSWIIASSAPEALLSLLGEESDCALILFCRPSAVTEAFIDAAAKLNNLMLAVEYTYGAGEVCGLLRQKELLYSVYIPYRGEDADRIIGDGLLEKISRLHPAFTLFNLIEAPSGIHSPLGEYAAAARSQQKFRTFAVDLWEDGRMIDAVISDDACAVCFDDDGRLWGNDNLNYRRKSLAEILGEAFPK